MTDVGSRKNYVLVQASIVSGANLLSTSLIPTVHGVSFLMSESYTGNIGWEYSKFKKFSNIKDRHQNKETRKLRETWPKKASLES